MTEADIMRLEDERYAAMLAKDVAALERLLHPDLVYMHSSGIADTKASYIAGVRDRVWDYTQSRAAIRPCGCTARSRSCSTA